MSVHTYIGARYVPRFVGTYDATQIYDALDVVDNGSGTSYIARKTVPAGTPLTDTDHWFVYGASSGAIIQLQNDMITAQNDILNLQGDMTSAQGDILNLQTDVATLKLYTGILSDRKFLLIGDSYAMTGQPYQSWQTLFETYSGASCTKEAINGGGFVAVGGGGGGTFEDGLDRNASISGLTDILVCGGANDNTAHTPGANASAISSAITSFISKARSLYPKARIHIAFIGQSTTNSYYGPLETSQGAYKTASLTHGASFIDLRYVITFSKYMYDYLHPTTTGMEIITKGLIANILGDDYNVNERIELTPTASTGLSFVATGLPRIEQYDGSFVFSMRDNCRMSGTISALGPNNWVDIFTLDVKTCNDMQIYGQAYAAITANGTNYDIPIIFTILDGTFYIKTMGAYSNITALIIYPFSVGGVI